MARAVSGKFRFENFQHTGRPDRTRCQPVICLCWRLHERVPKELQEAVMRDLLRRMAADERGNVAVIGAGAVLVVIACAVLAAR